MAETPDFQVFLTVFYYSVSILLMPIMSFFFSKVLFEGIFGAANTTGNVCSAVVAVVVLHIALGLFIFRAYSDTSKVDKKDDKVD